MTLGLFLFTFVGFVVGVWLLYQIAIGAMLLVWGAAGLGRLFGLAFIGTRTPVPLDGSAHPSEIEGEPLTEEFKANARRKLAPDMWTDGRRLYFEVGDRSYSVPADLEHARKRKNHLLAQRANQAAR
ncbi:hypothetical protein JQ596_38240 [Bradyrhizobium manausense]|uniref:hypothetical protein n=1 Tax=Bradyrhizobium manausense TaxID=989370 RepID=UPI001BACBE93|nr:hypothetical protein [Bradyrhizobium manausense]MBR0831362.1 hypothetical protein [Bradyrhizobium manausense]